MTVQQGIDKLLATANSEGIAVSRQELLHWLLEGGNDSKLDPWAKNYGYNPDNPVEHLANVFAPIVGWDVAFKIVTLVKVYWE